MMYLLFKKIIFKIFSKKLLMKNESFLRALYAQLYSGKKFQCNICGKKLNQFIVNQRNEQLCPKCGSLGRDRRLWQILNENFLVENSKILDFSPSRSLYKKLKSINKIDYSSTDLSGDFLADFQHDITNLDIESTTYDLIICYHILEHIENDLLAMQELHRVLKSEGNIIIQTPFKDGNTYENPLVTSPQERLKHFGQEDHVRIYSKEGLKNRLENNGFKVAVRHFNDGNLYYGFIKKETVFIVSKP
jgi:SAM-dependent methyltransferase